MTEIEKASERGKTRRGSGSGRSRLIAEELDVGLDPRSPGHGRRLTAVPPRRPWKKIFYLTFLRYEASTCEDYCNRLQI